MANLRFYNAEEAFEYFYLMIMRSGITIGDTKAAFNVGFYIIDPIDNRITTSWRKWNESYVEQEWQWYLSKDRSAVEIAKKAKIWLNMMDEDGNVNSNYGYQWSRSNQIEYVVDELKRDVNSRRAFISIYDAKEHELYGKDTPCTLNIGFNIVDNKLNMTVMMRSNDLVYGFCNDQYCFSKLQEMISNLLSIEVGTYFHFVHNLHIYSRHFDMKEKYFN